MCDAQRPVSRLRVCERIYDAYDNSWSEVSSWYWAGMLENTKGPWQSMTIARPVSSSLTVEG